MKRRNFMQLAGATAVASALPRFAFAQSSPATTLKFVPQADLSSLDPIYDLTSVTQHYAFAVYDTLFAMNGKYQPQPQMAEGYNVSDDGRIVLITLREDLKFHNGEPVRAQDCVASLGRWAAADSLGQTVGKQVDEWGVQDDKTIRVSLKKPFSYLIDALAKPGPRIPFIMPEHVAKTDATKPITESIGSGPFKFLRDEYMSGSHAAFEKNTDYVPRQEAPEWASGGKVVNFDRIEWIIMPDAGTASAALQNGEVDWWDTVQPDMVPLFQSDPNIKVDIISEGGSLGELRFNCTQAPFDNVKVRRAVLAAINQEDYMRAVTGNNPDAYKIWKSMYPKGTAYAEELGGDAMPGNLDKAKQMLADSGYAGEKIVLMKPTDFIYVAPFGDVAYDMLQKLGMNVELYATDWGSMLQRRANRGPVEQGGWSIFPTYAEATAAFSPPVNNFVRGQGDTAYPGWFKDDRIEQLSDQFFDAKDDASRKAAADDMQKEAFDQVPSLPLGQFYIPAAYRADLTGVVHGPNAFFWNVKRV